MFTALFPPSLAAFLIAAASSAPPDLTGIAAIITAGIGVVAFLATLLRGRANNERVEQVEEAASYVKGFDALVKRLQEQVDDLHEEIGAERVKWAAEKESLLETVIDLRAELREAVAQNKATELKLSELRGQIKGFLNAEQYSEFERHLR